MEITVHQAIGKRHPSCRVSVEWHGRLRSSAMSHESGMIRRLVFPPPD
jgi:hypothetical protein